MHAVATRTFTQSLRNDAILHRRCFRVGSYVPQMNRDKSEYKELFCAQFSLSVPSGASTRGLVICSSSIPGKT